MIFLNIGWMNAYNGLRGTRDEIVGGGSWVDENGLGHEVCNFLPCPDGRVYGHVETVRGDEDRQIRIERFGGSAGDDAITTDVIWTATHPELRTRRVVGWYLSATLCRNRQIFPTQPTRQHVIDEITTYRASADWHNATLLPPSQRLLKLGRGKGWMGETPWWTPKEITPEIRAFLDELERLMGDAGTSTGSGTAGAPSGKRSAGSATDPYTKYISIYEIAVKPRHTELQKRFVKYARRKFTKIESNIQSVDVRFTRSDGLLTLGEIKPCDAATVRFAIRTAMGQLLDYGQRCDIGHARIIILDCDPGDENRKLALENGFGICVENGRDFEITWPTDETRGPAARQ